MSRVTEWYPVSINPVRKGWYQVRAEDFYETWRYFDGKLWRQENGFPSVFGTHNRHEWRGLKEPA